MPNILKNMACKILRLQPPIEKAVRLSEDMQQTFALLSAFGIDERKVLRASESGVLNVTDPRIKDIVHFTGSGANDTQAGDDIECTQCIVMGHPDNGGKIWVRPNLTATASNAWPLDAGDVMGFTLDNLKQLNMLFVVDGEKAIVAYTR